MMKSFYHPLIAVITLIISFNVFGLGLQEAKNQGLVGEQPNGYLGIVGTATPEVTALVKEINAKRREAYQKIANKNQTALEAVEQLAGQKAMKKTTRGQYIKSSGRWEKAN